MYIEDSSIFILNITLVTITSYSDSLDPPGMATITTTDFPIKGISSKAAFHIAKDITLNRKSVITNGNFTSYEVLNIRQGGRTFNVVRSSITLAKLYVYRIADSIQSGMFIFLVYLQNRTMTLSKY